MAKPTIWQSLLGMPSQAYSFPTEKAYFSSKQHMLHVASEADRQQSTFALPSRMPRVDGNLVPPVMATYPMSGRKRDGVYLGDGGDDNETNEDFESAAGTDYRISVMTEDEDDGNLSDSEDDVFFTPNTSPRLSMTSSRSGGSSARQSRRSPGNSRKSSRRSLNSATTTNRPLSTGSSTNETSTASRTDINGQFSSGAAVAQRHQTKGPTSTSSLSSTSLDGSSLFSQPMSDSTRPTSPQHSVSGTDSRKSIESTGHSSTKYDVNVSMDDDWAKDFRWHNQPASKAPNSKKKPLPSPTIPNGNANHTSLRKQNKLMKTISKANPSLMMNMTALIEEDEDVLTSGVVNSQTYTDGSYPQSNVLFQEDNSRTSSRPTYPSTYLAPDDSFNSILRSASSVSPPPSTNTSSASTQSRDTVKNGTRNSINHTSNLRHRRSRSHEDLRSSSRSDSRSRSASITELASLPMPTGDLPSHGTPGFTSLVLPRAPPPTSLISRKQGPKLEPRTDGKIDLTRSGIAQTTMATVEVVHGLGATAKGRGLLGVLGRTMTLGRRKTVSRRNEDNGVGISSSGRGLSAHQPLGFTSYRKPPDYVPSSCVLVQVWAVGVDGIDARLVGLRLGSRGNNDARQFHQANAMNGSAKKGSSRWKIVRSAVAPAGQDHQDLQQPLVGYIPARSFVGRVLECGWGVGDETAKRADWVVGLLDVRKAGALSEFIVVDKRRVHRVPHPKMTGMSLKALGKQPERRSSTSTTRTPAWGLTLEELALLPLCGVPAYRAVRTFVYAFSPSATKDNGKMVTGSHRVMSGPNCPEVDHQTGRRRRALVLRGHDGPGAMAVRLLVAKGWNVSIHVPCPYPAESEGGDAYMAAVEERARAWGCDEIIFDDGLEGGGDEGRSAVVRVLERLWRDGDVIDAVLDTVGGKEIWEAAERVLKSSSHGTGGPRTLNKRGSKGYAQFTTLVGDSPSRVVPSASDLFKAGVRSLRMGGKPFSGPKDEVTNSPGKSGGGLAGEKRVGYAWVSTAQDVDWEGQDVSESLAAVLKLALEGIAKPWIGSPSDDQRVLPFERAPEVFVDDGPLSHGSTVIIKIVE
ncbi:hypothetical protein APHAL10511_005605 [Amanita phalloides]|nr:hypothetical protein APHAL10511_005605 [Amanita phalloides]